MTQNAIAHELAVTTKITFGESFGLLATLAAFTRVQLKRGQPVRVPHFGRFFVSLIHAKGGRNPRTGAAINLSQRYRAQFRVYKYFRDQIN